MPEKLKQLLESLSPEEASQYWAWLDGTPDAIDQMIDIVVLLAPQESHCAENQIQG